MAVAVRSFWNFRPAIWNSGTFHEIDATILFINTRDFFMLRKNGE